MKNLILTLTILAASLFCLNACKMADTASAAKPNDAPKSAARTIETEPSKTPVTKGKTQKEIDIENGSVKADDYKEVEPVDKKSADVCNVYAYVIDKDPAGLNVRDSFDKGNVIGKIPQDADGTIVHLISTNFSGWVQIDSAKTVEGKVVFDKKGWVSAALLGTSTTGYGGQGVELLEAGPGSKVVTFVPPETEVKMFSCDKTSVRIKYKNFTGWLDEDQACPNPVTNCS